MKKTSRTLFPRFLSYENKITDDNINIYIIEGYVKTESSMEV